MCAYLQEHVERAVSLRELSRLTGLSTYATQRLFERVTGMTPRRYQLGLRAAKVRRKLGRGSGSQGTATITEAVYEAGYSASSRFYEKSDEVLGMRPVRFRDGGRGESIEACVVACSFGQLLVARTERGFCQIALGDSADQLEADLRKRFHQAGSIAVHEPGESSLQNAVLQVLSLLTERPGALDLPLDLRATVFQERVWQALRGIPRGETRSYRQIAEAIGKPSASRAVARACASNHLALAIPCHRVVGSDGDLRGYRWGAERKRRILALEKAIRPTAIKGRGMQASAFPPPDA
jgi:AraC family transcriptional regulator of adaptative response/methylated-DNA-[protein]-cysteine methyltransferase